MTLTTVRKPEGSTAKSSQPTTRRKPEPGPDPTRKPTGSPSVPRYLTGEVAPEAKPSAAPAARPAEQLGPSVPLPPEAAARYSQAYGQDLSGVRVHPESPAPGALGARALATGNDIAFARGEYQPATPAGQAVLGHELAHVVQQSRGQKGVQGKGLSEDSYEQEADAAASAASSGSEAPDLSPLSAPAVQLLKAPASAPASPGAASKPKNAPGKAGKGEVDLSQGTLNPEGLSLDAQGKVMARLPGLAEGEIALEKKGGAYQSKGQGSAIALTLPVLGTISDSLVLIVRVANNAISGHISIGAPGQKVSGKDTKIFNAIQKAPDALGWAGLSNVSISNMQNALEGGRLSLGGDITYKIGGFVEMRGGFTMQDTHVSLSGEGDVSIKGGSGGHLKAQYSPETGLSGEASLQVGLGKLSGQVAAKLERGFLQVQGTVGYSDDRLKGSVTLMATDLATAKAIIKTDPQAGQFPDTGGGASPQGGAGAAPTASQKPGPRAFCGWGELDFSLTEWLTGKAQVVVNDQGDATVKGEIAPPKEIILFEQKDWTKSLAKFEVRAAYGLPVVGNVFVFANIGLEALATIGPGKLYNIKLSGQYSTDKSVDQELNLQASLNISAFAGLRLRAEGGVGVELLGHDIKAGVGVFALAGVRGYVEATPTIGYRKKAGAAGEFYIKGHMELAAQPFLGLGGDLFVEVDSPWWSPLPDDKWTWPLGSIEYPLPGEFGLGADVEHVLGSKTWPQIQFKEVDFDGSKFMSDLLSESAPSKSKSGEDKKQAKWNEGGGSGTSEAGSKGSKDSKDSKKKGGNNSQKKPKDSKKPKGGTKDKEKPDKDKKAAAPGKVGESVNFNARGEAYRLWPQVKGKSATLMVSKPQQSALSWIAAEESKTGNQPKDVQARAHSIAANARKLAATIDQQADQVASGTGDKKALQKANDQLKKDEHTLAGLLRQLAELSGGSKGEFTVGESVPFSDGQQAHRLYFVVKGSDAVLMVASTPMSVEARLKDFETRLKGGEGELESFSNHLVRDEVLQLIANARSLDKGLNGEADALVRDHLAKTEKATSAEKKMAHEEQSLASILAALYEKFGEHPGTREAGYDIRAPYSGAAGAGELSIDRAAKKEKEGRTYVVASGPIVGLLKGAKQGRVVEEVQALEKQFNATGEAQKILPPSNESVRGALKTLAKEASETEKAFNQYLKSKSKKKADAPPTQEAQTHLNDAARAADVVASVKRIGAGEIVERAVSALADEKMKNPEEGKEDQPRNVFTVTATLNRQLAQDRHKVKQQDLDYAVEFEEEKARQQHDETSSTSKNQKRGYEPTPHSPKSGPRKGYAPKGEPDEELTSTISTSYTGPMLKALGTYEEIKQAIQQAGEKFFVGRLLRVIHGQEDLKRKKKEDQSKFQLVLNRIDKETGELRQDVITKDIDQFISDIAVLFHVEMTRAPAAWAFGSSGLVNATTAAEAAAAFNVDVFPHAMEGFMKQYAKLGPEVFDAASTNLFKRLKAEFKQKYGFEEGQHVYLAPDQILEAIDTFKEVLSDLYDRALAKGSQE